MKKILTCLALCTLLLALCSSGEAQQPTKIPRIGYLAFGDPTSAGPPVEAFRQGLREFGYVEGENILVEYRYAEGRQDRVPSLVNELVQLKVDALVVIFLPELVQPRRRRRQSLLSWWLLWTRWRRE